MVLDSANSEVLQKLDLTYEDVPAPSVADPLHVGLSAKGAALGVCIGVIQTITIGHPFPDITEH